MNTYNIFKSKRKILFTTTLLILFITGCTDNQTNVDWPAITQESKPWTRWWWMGNDVDSVNLTYNLEALSQAGIGGVEVTPIYGVKGREEYYIDYLSPRWMNLFAFTESEAARLGIGVDMNLGTGWPFGGPDITIEDAATKAIFQQYNIPGGKRLKEPITVQDQKQKEYAVLSKVMAYPVNEGEKMDLTAFVSPEGILEWTAPEDNDYQLTALFIGKTLQMVKRAAPGGAGYVLNHFDAEAVRRYFNKFEKAFTENKVPFPHNFFNDSYEVYGADWTPDLLDQFEKRRGYKLQDYFPELLAEGKTEQSIRVMADYRETIGEILKENFTQPWTEWAHTHQVKTRNQAHGSPANLLDIYASVDIPECESFGITDFDIPYLRKDSIRKQNDSDPTILKYASSAAHVAGKPYTSSETFTWLTEHFRTSLSQCKAEIDQLFTSGVNRVYFHGTTYSPREASWPGWKFYASVDMSPTNTIWRDAPAFFDYIARVQSFLQDGKPDNDFLLYMPMYDIWKDQRNNYFTTFAIHGMRERLPKFCDGVEQIMKSGYDLDYISDHFLQSTTVENGLLKTTGGATYKALILPAAHTIPIETMQRIKDLADEGATIVFAENYPNDIPGLYDLDQRKTAFRSLIGQLPEVSSFGITAKYPFGKGMIITGSNYNELLAACNVAKEPFISETGGQLIRRKHADGHHYFLAMLSNNPVDEWIPLGVKAKSAVFFDPLTGNKGLAKTREHNGRTEVYMQLQPGESLILKTFTHLTASADPWKYYQLTGNELPLNNNWQLQFTESDPVINETFQIPTLGSWTDLENENAKKNRGTARYSITFDMQKNENKEYRLCLGDVRESARIILNGKEIATLFSVPFETNIARYLQNGTNTLEIEVTNLPANRIADYDRRGVEWRIFQEINFVSITYQPTIFDSWGVIPSGLLGPVSIKELKDSD